MPFERRNEPLMLRQFSRMYPSYNLNPLLRRRHQQLVEAQAFFPFHTHCTRVQLANVRAGVARPLYWWQSNCQEITMSAQKPSEANGTTKPEPKAPKTQTQQQTHQPNTDKRQRNGQEPTNETTEETQHNQQTKEHGRRTSNNSARTTTTKDEEQHARNQQTKPKARPRTKPTRSASSVNSQQWQSRQLRHRLATSSCRRPPVPPRAAAYLSQ